MFTTLGFEGYRLLQQHNSDIAQHIAAGVAAMGPYELVSDGSQLPVLSFALKPEVTNYTVFDVSDRLRERGWLVPAYTYPENRHRSGRPASRGASRHELRHGRPPPQ